MILMTKIKEYKPLISGQIKEIYLPMIPFWTQRLVEQKLVNGANGRLTETTSDILLRRGFSKSAAKEVIVTVTLDVGIGRKEWGAPDHVVYILKILEVKECKKNGR